MHCCSICQNPFPLDEVSITLDHEVTCFGCAAGYEKEMIDLFDERQERQELFGGGAS